MNCIEVQRLMMPFIDNKLSMEQLEEFMQHIRSCPDCMEELEVHYILLTGMRRLDADKELSDNFHEDFIELLSEYEEKIVHYKFAHIRKRIILILVIAAAAIASSLHLGEVVEEVLKDEPKTSTFYSEELFFPDLEGNRSKEITFVPSGVFDEKIMYKLDDIYAYLVIEDEEGAKLLREKFPEHFHRSSPYRKQ
jgi:hypothetical protein